MSFYPEVKVCYDFQFLQLFTVSIHGLCGPNLLSGDILSVEVLELGNKDAEIEKIRPLRGGILSLGSKLATSRALDPETRSSTLAQECDLA